MAKKGGVQQLQTEVNTDDELHKFLEREGLLVLDVYTDWCGPCLGMVGSLKKIKLELGGDDLHLAICRVDEIEMLKRFRNRSEPTWLFASKRKVVNLMFGANVPKLMKMIAKLEKSERAGEIERTFYDFEELTPAEKERVEEKNRLEEEATKAEEEATKKKRRDFIVNVTGEIMSNIRDHGVMLLMPQVPKDSFRRISESADPFGVTCKDKRIVKLQPEMLEILHFECDNPLPDDVLEAIFDKELQAVAWKVSEQETRPVEEVLQLVHAALTEPQYVTTQNEAGEEVEIQLSPVLATAEVDPPRKTPSPNREINTEELTKVVIPAAWTPVNRRANAALIYLFFRNLTEFFLPSDPVPDPPHLAIIFDAFKKQDIMDACLKHKDAVLAYGYFTRS
uniref:Thioredoxin domain-containing protein n=1 Tax=Phlebotomus papatasi TaxID=29031 RepID=A0A1B0D8R6_PHLPP